MTQATSVSLSQSCVAVILGLGALRGIGLPRAAQLEIGKEIVFLINSK